eukprot:Skav236560  [mRNA]  locus=scaffold1066:298797:303181:- [translate_table: standard]
MVVPQLLHQDSIHLLVWHTLLGYWGGVAPGRGYAVASKRPWWPSGLRQQCPNEVDVWEGDFSVLAQEASRRRAADFERFYSDFYAALAAAGIAGVKCDGQFLADLLSGPAQVHCDWDMLKTSEWHCHIHAVARAVAGCPVYVSDPADDARRPWWLVNSTCGGFIAAAFGLCDTGDELMKETLFPTAPGQHCGW